MKVGQTWVNLGHGQSRRSKNEGRHHADNSCVKELHDDKIGILWMPKRFDKGGKTMSAKSKMYEDGQSVSLDDDSGLRFFTRPEKGYLYFDGNYYVK